MSLDISGCACGDQGLSALGNNTRFKDVTLAECHKITDLGLQKFSQQCKDINRLNLAHCWVTNARLRNAASVPILDSTSRHPLFLQNLTDGAIKNLAFCCRLLNVLNLAGCKLVSNHCCNTCISISITYSSQFVPQQERNHRIVTSIKLLYFSLISQQ